MTIDGDPVQSPIEHRGVMQNIAAYV